MNTDEKARMIQSWINSCWPIGKWAAFKRTDNNGFISWVSILETRSMAAELSLTLFTFDGNPNTIRMDVSRKPSKAYMLIECPATAKELARAMGVITDWVGPSLADMVNE